MQRVGRSAGRILEQARAMVSESEIRRGRPRVPTSNNYAMFDIEGMPPHLTELDKVYLWGVQVFGGQGGPYQAAVAGFGPDGDRQGWQEFLALARQIFAEHGDIPFVHWHHYEIVKLRAYIDRHGDPDGTAARVQQNCLDLLPITRDAIVLPTPSYSLKVVEQHVGYRRTLDEYGGDWSMARYIEATEIGDEAKRQAIMDEILAYNREDLEATWAVLNWLRDLA
jgi:predicted RecB family nuclease